MSLAGTVGVGDKLGLIRALQVVRLHRACVILVMGSVADKRTPLSTSESPLPATIEALVTV